MQTYRHKKTYINGQIKTYKHTDIYTNIQNDKQIHYIHIHTDICRQADRQTHT